MSAFNVSEAARAKARTMGYDDAEGLQISTGVLHDPTEKAPLSDGLTAHNLYEVVAACTRYSTARSLNDAPAGYVEMLDQIGDAYEAGYGLFWERNEATLNEASEVAE